MMVVPGAGSGLVRQAAAQLSQPTPTLPPILPGGGDPDPSPSPTESEPPGGGGGGGGQGPGGGGGGQDPDEEDPENEGKGDGDKPGDRKKGDKPGADDDKNDKKKKKKKKKDDDEVLPTPSIPGSFNTEELLDTAARLRSLGLSEDEVAS
jgi:hypothetical protein